MTCASCSLGTHAPHSALVTASTVRFDLPGPLLAVAPRHVPCGSVTRVLHVSQPTEAGVANVLLSLVKDQVARGWEVHVAAPLEGHLLADAGAAHATTHHWAAVRSPGLSTFFETLRLRQIVEAAQPDLVHLHSAKAGLAGRLAVRGSRQTIFQPHAWSFEAVTGSMKSATREWERFARRWTDLTVCVSEAEMQMGRRERCLGRQSVVIPNGVDTDHWSPQDRDAARRLVGIPVTGQVVVCVGRLSRQKGQDVLLDAWPEVRRRFRSAHLYLVGDGPNRQELESRQVPGITLVGQAGPQPWLAAADVVVIPSRWEGMPLILLEAMSSGRAVVAAHVNGTAETLVDERLLVRPDDAADLTRAIADVLSDPSRRAELEEKNREHAIAHLDVRRAAEATAVASQSLKQHRQRQGPHGGLGC